MVASAAQEGEEMEKNLYSPCDDCGAYECGTCTGKKCKRYVIWFTEWDKAVKKLKRRCENEKEE